MIKVSNMIFEGIFLVNDFSIVRINKYESLQWVFGYTTRKDMYSSYKMKYMYKVSVQTHHSVKG